MRIDQSDLADEPGPVHRARLARDGPGSPGKDLSGAAQCDGRIGRAEAYRAAVDSAYRQDAINRDCARSEVLGRETATPVKPRVRAEGPERHLVGLEDRLEGEGWSPQTSGHENPRGSDGTTVDSMQTGARGPASGREFDPEAAGGPIRQLDARKARITGEGVQEVTTHLQRFTGSGSLQVPEQGMVDRLRSIAAGDMEPESYDLNFYTHELDEADRYAQLGFGPGSGVDLGSSEMYEVWNDVHTAALEDYGISDRNLFHPRLAP